MAAILNKTKNTKIKLPYRGHTGDIDTEDVDMGPRVHREPVAGPCAAHHPSQTASISSCILADWNAYVWIKLLPESALD